MKNGLNVLTVKASGTLVNMPFFMFVAIPGVMTMSRLENQCWKRRMTAAPLVQFRTWRRRSVGCVAGVMPSVELAKRSPFCEYSSIFLHAFSFGSNFPSSGDAANLSEEFEDLVSLSASWFRM